MDAVKELNPKKTKQVYSKRKMTQQIEFINTHLFKIKSESRLHADLELYIPRYQILYRRAFYPMQQNYTFKDKLLEKDDRSEQNFRKLLYAGIIEILFEIKRKIPPLPNKPTKGTT